MLYNRVMANLLPTTGSSQSQTTTQSPQAGAQSSLSGTAKSSSVQPGTTSSLLNDGTGSVALHPTVLPSINLSKGIQSTTAPATTAPAKHHQVNPVLMGFSIGLFVLAVLLFWLAGRTTKHNVI